MLEAPSAEIEGTHNDKAPDLPALHWSTPVREPISHLDPSMSGKSHGKITATTVSNEDPVFTPGAHIWLQTML